MPSYMRPGNASDYARWVTELTDSKSLRGRAVESWRQTVSEDTLTLYLSVTYVPLQPPSAWRPATSAITEMYAFPALAVLALEGKR